MREEAVSFGARQTLIGVVTWPSALDRGQAAPLPPGTPRGAPAPPKALDGVSAPPGARGKPPTVLLLNAGVLHHIGPNRTYVKIARSLAALGIVVLRFDFSGVGDSLPREDTLPFEQAAVEEAQQAMATLHALAGSTEFVLMGLCSGAQVALDAALSDTRVTGAVLINPNMHLHDNRDDELSTALRKRALLHHYQRLALSSSFRSKSWLKTVTGNLNWPLLGQAIGGFRPRNLLRRQQVGSAAQQYALAKLHALSARGVRLLHVYSEGDEGLDYFRLLLGKESAAQPVELIRGANHSFTPLWSQERLVEVIWDWVRSSILVQADCPGLPGPYEPRSARERGSA